MRCIRHIRCVKRLHYSVCLMESMRVRHSPSLFILCTLGMTNQWESRWLLVVSSACMSTSYKNSPHVSFFRAAQGRVGTLHRFRWYRSFVGASLSEPHTSGSRFNRGTSVTFPKVYATNTEGPPLLVVYSIVVRASRSRKFMQRTRKAPQC